MGVEAPKRVVKRLESGLKLRYQENRVDFPIIRYYELIGKASYPLINPE